jgi:hypothetical protein
MKILKNNTHLLLIAALPMLLIGTYIYFHLTTFTPQLFKIDILCLLACLMLLLKPNGNTTQNSTTTTTPIHKRLLKVWGFQIATTIMFIGFIKCLFVISRQPTSTVSIFSHTTHLSLFPWSIYTLISIALLKLAYRKKQPIRLCELTLTKKTKKDSTKTIFWISHFSALTANAIALCLSLTGLYLMHFFFPNIHNTEAGWTPATIVCASILTYVNYAIIRSRILDKLFIKKTPLIAYLIMLSIFSSIIIGLIYAVANQVSTAVMLQPSLLTSITSISPEQATLISSLSWWLIWLPISSLYLTTICYGLTIRKAIAMLISLPIILLCLQQLSPNLNIDKILITREWITPLAIIIFFSLLTLFCKQKNKNILTASQTPIPANTKLRSHTRLMKKITFFFLTYLTVLLLGGYFITNIILFSLITATLIFVSYIIITSINRTIKPQPKQLQDSQV